MPHLEPAWQDTILVFSHYNALQRTHPHASTNRSHLTVLLLVSNIQSPPAITIPSVSSLFLNIQSQTSRISLIVLYFVVCIYTTELNMGKPTSLNSKCQRTPRGNSRAVTPVPEIEWSKTGGKRDHSGTFSSQSLLKLVFPKNFRLYSTARLGQGLYGNGFNRARVYLASPIT